MCIRKERKTLLLILKNKTSTIFILTRKGNFEVKHLTDGVNAVHLIFNTGRKEMVLFPLGEELLNAMSIVVLLGVIWGLIIAAFGKIQQKSQGESYQCL